MNSLTLAVIMQSDHHRLSFLILKVTPNFLLVALWLSTLSLLLLLRSPLLGSGLLSSDSLSTIVLAYWLQNGLLLLGLDDGNGIRQRLGWARLALGVRTAHDLDLDTKHTLAEQDVAGSLVDEVLSGLTGVDHEAVLNTTVSI